MEHYFLLECTTTEKATVQYKTSLPKASVKKNLSTRQIKAKMCD